MEGVRLGIRQVWHSRRFGGRDWIDGRASTERLVDGRLLTAGGCKQRVSVMTTACACKDDDGGRVSIDGACERRRGW